MTRVIGKVCSEFDTHGSRSQKEDRVGCFAKVIYISGLISLSVLGRVEKIIIVAMSHETINIVGGVFSVEVSIERFEKSVIILAKVCIVD